MFIAGSLISSASFFIRHDNCMVIKIAKKLQLNLFRVKIFDISMKNTQKFDMGMGANIIIIMIKKLREKLKSIKITKTTFNSHGTLKWFSLKNQVWLIPIKWRKF